MAAVQQLLPILISSGVSKQQRRETGFSNVRTDLVIDDGESLHRVIFHSFDKTTRLRTCPWDVRVGRFVQVQAQQRLYPFVFEIICAKSTDGSALWTDSHPGLLQHITLSVLCLETGPQ